MGRSLLHPGSQVSHLQNGHSDTTYLLGELRMLNKGIEALLIRVTLTRRVSLGLEGRLDDFKRCFKTCTGLNMVLGLQPNHPECV